MRGRRHFSIPFDIAFAPALRTGDGNKYGQGTCAAESWNSFSSRHASFAWTRCHIIHYNVTSVACVWIISWKHDDCKTNCYWRTKKRFGSRTKTTAHWLIINANQVQSRTRELQPYKSVCITIANIQTVVTAVTNLCFWFQSTTRNNNPLCSVFTAVVSPRLIVQYHTIVFT